MRDLALAMGVPADRVVIEPAARNTLENALFSARIAHGRGWRSLLVVTDRYHLPRALMAFRRVGLEVAGSAAPAGSDSSGSGSAWAVELVKWAPFVWRLAVRHRRAMRAVRSCARR